MGQIQRPAAVGIWAGAAALVAIANRLADQFRLVRHTPLLSERAARQALAPQLAAKPMAVMAGIQCLARLLQTGAAAGAEAMSVLQAEAAARVVAVVAVAVLVVQPLRAIPVVQLATDLLEEARLAVAVALEQAAAARVVLVQVATTFHQQAALVVLLPSLVRL